MPGPTEAGTLAPVTEHLVDIPFEVARHDHGLRLDVFLSRRIARMSRSLAARLVRNGRVRKEPFDGILRPSVRVAHGDRVIVKRKPLDEGPTDHIHIPVVHEDTAVVAVNKPGDLVVHPTASAYHRTAIRILRDRLGEPNLDLAHRIDKETSGLLLLARHFDAASSLKKQFAQRRVDKSYLAVVHGRPARDRFRVDAPLRLADTVSKVVMEVAPGGGAAVTDIEVLARGPSASLVVCKPHTGRQHQIRVHLLHVGHPIVGDKLYVGGEQFFMDALKGDHEPLDVETRTGHLRQALHAWRIAFDHPESGARTTLDAPLTPDLQELCRRHGIPADPATPLREAG